MNAVITQKKNEVEVKNQNKAICEHKESGKGKWKE